MFFYDKDLRAWKRLSPSSRRLVKAFIWAGVFSAICLLVIATAGCAYENPITAPSSVPSVQIQSVTVTLPARLALGCSGQSNAELLCREGGALRQVADVTGWALGQTAIVCWDEHPGPAYNPTSVWGLDWGPLSVGMCWKELKPMLAQPMHAFVWWQGEWDRAAERGTYLAKLTNLMARVRAENRNPNLLIVVVQLSPLYDGFTPQIELKEWAQRDPRAIYIPTADLPYPDDLHMTIDFSHPGLSVGYQTVAQRIDVAVRAALK